MLIFLKGLKWSVQTSPTFHTDLQDQGNRFAARRSRRNHHLVMRCRRPNENLDCRGLHVCGWWTVCTCFSSMWNARSAKERNRRYYWSQTSVEMAFFRPYHAPLVSVTWSDDEFHDRVQPFAGLASFAPFSKTQLNVRFREDFERWTSQGQDLPWTCYFWGISNSCAANCSQQMLVVRWSLFL